MLLRLSPGPVKRPLQNVPYTPGRDLRLPYPVELYAPDYPLGTTMVSALLVAEPSFGLSPTITKPITTAPSANGQITDTGADGVGALYFALMPEETAQIAGEPVGFEVIVVDSLGRQATLDIGSLVPAESTLGAPVDHVVVAPSAFAVTDPGTEQLTVTAYDADGNVVTGRLVNWTSSDPLTASVDPTTGLVTGIGAGVVLFTATIEGKSASSTGTFTTNVTTVTVTPSPVSVPAGQTRQFTAVARDIAGVIVPNQQFVWSSTDPLKATVDQAGLATTVAIGTSSIVATIANTLINGNAALTVLQAQDGSVADVRAYVGDASIIRWADLAVGGTVTVVSGKVTAVSDPRGGGFGPNLVGTGTTGPAWDAANLLATLTQDSDQYFQWPAAADLDMSQNDFWIAIIGVNTAGAGNPFVSWDDGSTGFGASAQALSFNDSGTVYEKNGFRNPYTQVDSIALFPANRTSSPSSRTAPRLIIVEKHHPSGLDTQQHVFQGFAGLEVYGAGRMIWFNAGSTPTAFLSGNAVVNIGRESGLNTVGIKIKAVLCGTGVLTVAQRQSLARRAVALGGVIHATANAVAAVPTKLVTISHDSNSAGYGTTNTDTKAWPVLMQTALNTAFPNTWLVKQDGWAGTTALDHDAWLTRITLPQINPLLQTKHIHIVGTQIVNDLEAVVPANSAVAIIAALQSQCTQAKAAGAKVLLMTCARSPSNDETSIPVMGTVNTWCRGAVAAGYADDLYDIYTAIGPAAGDPHFNDAQNAQIAVDVQAHVVAL
jgi:hypothetical protein